MNPKYYNPRHATSSTSFVVQADTEYKELNRPVLSDILSVSESVVTDDENGLNYLSSALFTTVLEDAIAAMNVLEQCNTALRLKKTFLNMDALVKKKYAIRPSLKPEDSVRYPLDCDENKIEKIIEDRELCLRMLKTMYREMCVNHTYQRLQTFLKDKEIEENKPLANDVSIKRRKYREVKKQLRSQRHVHRLAKYDSEDRIRALIDLVGDTEQISAIKNNYLSGWKAAQTEQHSQKIFDAQKAAIDNIIRNRIEVDREMRAHYEIDRFQNVLMMEQQEKIDRIMEQYEEGIEDMDLKIQVSMSQLAATRQKRIELEEKLAKRQQEIDAWSKYKAERAAKEAHINKMNEAANTVQAWWRGLLVRQQLGPYKPGKKGKPAKKKKNVSEDLEEVDATDL